MPKMHFLQKNEHSQNWKNRKKCRFGISYDFVHKKLKKLQYHQIYLTNTHKLPDWGMLWQKCIGRNGTGKFKKKSHTSKNKKRTNKDHNTILNKEKETWTIWEMAKIAILNMNHQIMRKHYIFKKKYFELGTMFTSTKRANKKMMKTKITKELRINNANKISPGEIKLQN